MSDVAGFFVVGAVLAMLVSWIWVVVLAFKESAGWGIGSLLVNPIALIYAITRAEKCKIPLILFFVGFLIFIAIVINSD